MAGDRIDRLDLAPVALRCSGIQQDHAAETVGERLAVDDVAPSRRQGHRGGRPLRDIGRQRQARRRPGADPAVEEVDVAMTEVVEHPPQPCRVAAADVVVGHDRVLVADPELPEVLSERARVGEGMASWCAEPLLVREVRIEVEVDRTRDVPGIVGRPSGPRLAEDPAHVHDADA